MKTITTEKMKCFAAICLSFIIALSVHAQQNSAPPKMSYQAVVRDATNNLLVRKTVSIRVSILQGSSSGSSVYRETQSAQTNANGLVSISIGEGTDKTGDISTIEWSNGPFFIKTEIDPNGANNYILTSTTQLLSVPYALYAEKAGNAFDGQYESLNGKPELAKVATSNDYADLANTPTMVSQLENDAKYLQTEQQQLKLDGTYLSITDKDGEVLNTITLPSASTGGVTDYEKLDNKPEGANQGDILYWNSSTKRWNTLGMGLEGQILSVSGGKLNWTDPSFIVNTETYAEGDIFYQNETAEGIIIKADKMARSGWLLSLKESTLAYSTVFTAANTGDSSDGINNMTTIVGITGWESNYPAFKDCRTAGDAWYLPSSEELKFISSKKDEINAKLTAANETPLSQDFYWASNERDINYAYGVAFNSVSITDPYSAIQADEKYIVTTTVPSHEPDTINGGFLDSLAFVSLDIPKNEYIQARKNTLLGVRAMRKLSWSELTSKPGSKNSYNIGDIYYASDKTTPLGIVYQTTENKAHGKILSLAETTGKAWDALSAWCTTLGPAWVIPTEKEWKEIAALKTMLNTVLVGKSHTGLATDKPYWSSTKDGEDTEKAKAVTLTTTTSEATGIITDGYKSESTAKTTTIAGRAIMEF